MTVHTAPSWLRVVVTAIISALCCGGLVAAICVWWFHPGSTTDVQTDSVPSQQFADDAGGASSTPLLSGQNPLHIAKPSVSVEGHFSHSAVAVDSEPCSVIGRSDTQITSFLCI